MVDIVVVGVTGYKINHEINYHFPLQPATLKNSVLFEVTSVIPQYSNFIMKCTYIHITVLGTVFTCGFLNKILQNEFCRSPGQLA